MSRIVKPLTEHITIIYGKDHSIGNFVDITDSRFANSKDDEQGEGYIFEWSQLFGASTNLPNLKIDIRLSDDYIIKTVNKWIKEKGYENNIG